MSHAESHAAPGAPFSAEECAAVFQDRGDDFVGAPIVVGLGCIRRAVQESDESLVDLRPLNHLGAGKRADAIH